MLYKTLMADIARRTGLSVRTVKAVLSATPDALLEMDEGEHVRTPLGTFRMTRREPRHIKLPDGPVAAINGMYVVRLKPGRRVKKNPVSPGSAQTACSTPT